MKEELKKIRNLSMALFLSGALNIIFLSFLFSWTLYDIPSTKTKSVVMTPKNKDSLRSFKAKTYEQLIPLLSKGKEERDLALGSLVSFHDFDLERALGNSKVIAKKKIFDDGKDKIPIFPSLSNKDFDLILDFIKIEKWPLKPKGLFSQLKTKQEESLYEAFYLTPQFAALEALFKDVNRKDIVQMALEGGWGLLSALPDENRQKVLLTYIKERSKTAALILLRTDSDFAKSLPDETLLTLLPLLIQNSVEVERFLSAIASNSKSEHLKTLAITSYQEVVGRPWEPLISRKTAPVKPEVIEKAIAFPKQNPLPSAKKHLLYIVQDGDNLWKIAKRFKVSIEEIRKINPLKNDALKPGTPLKIPSAGN